MEYYFNRDYLHERFDNDENKLTVYCSIGQTIFNQEISFKEDMSINFNCSCGTPYCDHLEILINFIKNNYYVTQKNKFFKIQYENINIFLNIPVSGSKGDLYLIKIKYDYSKNFSYDCSCGLKYTKYCRHKCKHIENTLVNIVRKFDSQKEDYEENNSIIDAIDNLNINT